MFAMVSLGWACGNDDRPYVESPVSDTGSVEDGGSGSDPSGGRDTEAEGTGCTPACEAYGEHAIAECTDGSCEYACEPGWVDANEDYTRADEPDPEGDGCEYECTETNGGEEICDGEDNDCDGETDEGFDLGEPCTVGTGACQVEGETVCSSSGEETECGATPNEPSDETCGDGVDNDCDGMVDEDDAVDAQTWYEDADGDGRGNPSVTTTACDKPEGYVASGDDCDDGDASVWKEMTGYEDADGDGWTTGGAQTLCTDGSLPDGYRATQKAEDCDDGDASVWKEMTGYEDADGDGWTTGGAQTLCTDGSLPDGYRATQKAEDCDDGDADVNPAASEKCNGIDDDCDGHTDEDDAIDATTWYPDCDDDGYADDTSGSETQCDEPGSAPSGCGSNQPGGWTQTRPADGSTTDCADDVSEAHPGQSAYFADGYDLQCDFGVCQPTNWDYDCDGSETKKWTDTNCSAAQCVSGGDSFWEADSPPECGHKGTWATCSGSNCGMYNTEERRQKCR